MGSKHFYRTVLVKEREAAVNLVCKNGLPAQTGHTFTFEYGKSFSDAGVMAIISGKGTETSESQSLGLNDCIMVSTSTLNASESMFRRVLNVW